MNDNNQPNPIEKAGFSRGHALLVAVAAYPKVSPLPPAVINDAREVTAVLTSLAHCGYDPRNVTTLLDSQATLEAIRRELGALANRAKPDDIVMIFFSGHGARLGNPNDPDSALIPFDCDPSDVSATVLLETEFSSLLAGIKAQRLVVFVDACHSGGAGSFKAIQIRYTGFVTIRSAALVAGSGSFEATAWYAPDLGRIIRFDVKTNNSALRRISRETVELMRISRAN